MALERAQRPPIHIKTVISIVCSTEPLGAGVKFSVQRFKRKAQGVNDLAPGGREIKNGTTKSTHKGKARRVVD